MERKTVAGSLVLNLEGLAVGFVVKTSQRNRISFGAIWGIGALVSFGVSWFEFSDVLFGAEIGWFLVFVGAIAVANFLAAWALAARETDVVHDSPGPMVIVYAIAVPGCSYFVLAAISLAALGAGFEVAMILVGFPIMWIFFPTFGWISLGMIVVSSYLGCYYLRSLRGKKIGRSPASHFREEAHAWRQYLSRHRIVIGMVVAALIALIGYVTWQERGLARGYSELAAALDDERWEEAYGMMTPDYRAEFDLDSFVKEGVDLPAMTGGRNVSAFRGRGRIFPRGGGGFDGGTMFYFEKVGDRWCYTGEKLTSY